MLLASLLGSPFSFFGVAHVVVQLFAGRLSEPAPGLGPAFRGAAFWSSFSIAFLLGRTFWVALVLGAIFCWNLFWLQLGAIVPLGYVFLVFSLALI